MDQGLFKKHIQQILSRVSLKQKIILTIKEKTGIVLEEEEIELSKKIIKLSVSSVKKATLLQKGSKEILEKLGYRVSI